MSRPAWSPVTEPELARYRDGEDCRAQTSHDGQKMPASTLVAVAALAQPEFLIEIEAIAVI